MVYIDMDGFEDLTQEEIAELRTSEYRQLLLPNIFQYCDGVRSELIPKFETPKQAVDDAMIKVKLILNGSKVSDKDVSAIAFIDRILRADVFDLTELYDEETISYIKGYSHETLESIKTLT